MSSYRFLVNLNREWEHRRAEQFLDADNGRALREALAAAFEQERALDEVQSAIPAWATDTDDVPLTAVVQGCISTLTGDLAAAVARATRAEAALAAEQENTRVTRIGLANIRAELENQR